MGCEQQIVFTARTWLGTRFQHQGRHKASLSCRGGVDCLGLLIGVAQELGLRSVADGEGGPLARYDSKEYGHMPDGAALRQALASHLHEVAVEDIRAGDVLLLCFDKAPQHLAIVTPYPDGGPGIIHALATARKVVEHPLDAEWHKRIICAYRIPAGCYKPI